MTKFYLPLCVLFCMVFTACKKTEDPDVSAINTIQTTLTQGTGTWSWASATIIYYSKTNAVLKTSVTAQYLPWYWKFNDAKSSTYYFGTYPDKSTPVASAIQLSAESGKIYLTEPKSMAIYQTAVKWYIESISDDTLTLTQTENIDPLIYDNTAATIIADHELYRLVLHKIK